MRTFVHYIPIATSIFSLAFSCVLFRRWRARGGLHLFWWSIGALVFGVGTITESITTLFGWHEPVFRAWYISGALLGGAPLAQGTVYLLLPRRTANRLTVLLLATVTVAATFVLLTPINYAAVETHRLTGAVMEWSRVRLFSPFINLYAATFLIGGAVLSAVRYTRIPGMGNRVIGNILIAVGALLPGIGGTFTRFGHVEVLYVTEFIGILLIYAGFRYNIATGPSPLGRVSADSGITPA
ncbi:MAG: hypothetical protein E4H28_05130, partial [Gemmatimonadales bacterium]